MSVIRLGGRVSLRRYRWLVALVGIAVLPIACGGEPVPLRDRLAVVDVTTGWFDAGIVDGKNKLVPTISLVLKNTGTDEIHGVQLNAVFRRVGEDDVWGEAFTRGIGQEALPPGGTTSAIVLRSQLGYTGEQPRAELFEHSMFIDADVVVFGKHLSDQWTPLSEQRIERQLLTR